MKFLSSILIVAICVLSREGNSQTVYGNYYNAQNQTWNLVEITPTTGEVREVGSIDGLAALLNLNNSFVVNSISNAVHFFGYDSNSGFRFYTVSLTDAEIISSPEIADEGWTGLTFNPNDSLLYVMKGLSDNLGTDLVRFNNTENGTFEFVQHTDLETVGQPAISTENVLVSQAVEYTTGIPSGDYYAVNMDITDSLQSFAVQSDFNSPEFILNLRYHTVKDAFYGLKREVGNSIINFILFDPSIGQSDLIADLSGYSLSNSVGGFLFVSGYYVFTGAYEGDTIQRVFSVDVETGEVVSDPALSLQVQIRSIDVDQNSLVGISEANESAKTISVFPNPATELIHFEASTNEEFKVLDAFGKELIRGQSTADRQMVLDVSSLVNGVYFLHLGANNAASFVIAR